MTLFASVSSGTSSASFAQRESKYNALIGKLDALRIQANARPTPRPLVLQTIGVGPSINSDPKNIEVLKSPTPAMLRTMIGTMTAMRDTDKQFGLTSRLTIGFKREFEISMDQALVYEKALER
jgi:hypothetical protein